MQPLEEQALRNRAATLALDWATQRTPPFSGTNAEDYRTVIEAAHVVADEAAIALRRWVDAARRAGLSWTEIGQLLGITKQAAQQRFRFVDEAQASGERVVRLGANAFNEMLILENEGREGNELMAVGVLSLTFRHTDVAWEYRREMGLAHLVRPALEREGWTLVASWFPFQYFKRVAGPAEE